MPDGENPWDQEYQQPSGVNPWEQEYQTPQAQQQPSALNRFVSGVGSEVQGLGRSWLNMASDPQNFIPIYGPARMAYKGVIQPAIQKGESAYKEFRSGNISAGALGAAATLDPFAPDVTKLYEQSASGDTAGAAGRGAVDIGLLSTGTRLPGKAVGAVQEFPTQHPFATEAIGRTVGAAGGAAIGPTLAHGQGGEFGALGGAYLGQRLGGDLAKAAVKASDAKVIQEVVTGNRDPLSVPARLQPTLKNVLKAQESAYADIAARQGIKPEQMDIPTGLREGVKKLYEERARESASLPSLIQTPEQLASQTQRAKAFGAQSSEMKPEASARGMAYAAGRHQTEWVPSKRGTEVSRTETFRRSPRIKEIQPPPK